MTTLSSLSGLPDVGTAEVIRILANRDLPPILTHPALVRADDVPLSGSGGIAIVELADGSFAPRCLVNDYDLRPEPYRKAYEITDLEAAVDRGLLSPDILAREGVISTTETIISLVAGLAPEFRNTTSNTGAALTLADFMKAKHALNVRSASGPYLCVMSSVQWAHLEASIAAAACPCGASSPFKGATLADLSSSGSGYKGRVLDVDVYVTDRVPTVGADHVACMISHGAVAWAAGSFFRSPEDFASIFDFRFGGNYLNGGIPFSFGRREGAWQLSVQLDLRKVIDAAGQRLISKATY